MWLFLIGALIGFVIVVSVELIAKHRRNKKNNSLSSGEEEE